MTKRPAAGPEDSRSRGAATLKDADPRPDGARNTSDQGVLSPLDHLSAPPPVPAPVDVEYVACPVCGAVHAGAPADAALLAQCREALEAAERYLAERFGLYAEQVGDKVRAALLAIKGEG